MTNAQHTPGNWEYDLNGLVYGQVKGDDDEAPLICDVVKSEHNGVADNEELANARLISAAPELLASLKGMLEVFVESDQLADFEDMETVKVARAAIAKAQGK